MRGWPRRTTIAALRSLFRFAKKQRMIFTNPTTAPSTCWECLEHMSMVGSVGRIFGVVG
jgi:hypothetical protein